MQSRSILKYFIISFLVHTLLFKVVDFTSSFTKTETPSTSVEVEILTPIQTEPKENMQIVQQNKVENSETPENAKYLSQSNQKVEKETVAKNHGKFQNSKETAIQNPQSQTPIAKTNQPKPGTQAHQKNSFNFFGGIDPQEGWKKQQSGESEALPRPITPDQNNSQASNSNESQTDDRLKDVDPGLETLVNSREFVYYSYHSRIREKLTQHWQPIFKGKIAKMLKQGRMPAATGQDYITSLIIVLNKKGILVGVKMIGKSGVQDLDDAAVEAFRAAAPFPNPPTGLIEQDGTIKIRWDFVLES